MNLSKIIKFFVLLLSIPELISGTVPGRPVNIVSIAFEPKYNLQQIVQLVSDEAQKKVDFIILPETCRGNDAESIDGKTIDALSKIAAQYKTYILCPIDRLSGSQRFNSAVLLDRNGIICQPIYDKQFPFWNEYQLQPPITPGSGELPIYDLDFGRIGVCICFDINFPSIWQTFADEKVEMVVWPSAYSGGSLLHSYASQHHFYIVTCTHVPDCTVVDIDGTEILYENKQTPSISHIQLDFDRCIFHCDFHEEFNGKLDLLLKNHGKDIFVEKQLKRERWFILKSQTAGVSAREYARAYGLEELADYINRSKKYRADFHCNVADLCGKNQ